MADSKGPNRLDSLGYIILSPVQVSQYYEHIDLPQRFRYPSGPCDSGSESSKAAQDPDLALPFLTALIRHHGASVPFENLTLHYDRSRVVSLHHDTLFEKVVMKVNDAGERCNRGGYCMENNGLFLCVLRSLGFDVYPTGARVNKSYGNKHNPPLFEGWLHQVNLVRIGDTTYLTDVGIGSAMPTSPLPLTKASSSKPMANHGNSFMRLVQGNILDNTSQSAANQQLWTYQTQSGPDNDNVWQAITCFSEIEFTQYDFEIINTFAYTSRRMWMTSNLMGSKLILNDSSDVIGMVTLWGATIKRRLRGTETSIECKTEDERVKALETYFGIRLTRDERRGIRGLSSALIGAGTIPAV